MKKIFLIVESNFAYDISLEQNKESIYLLESAKKNDISLAIPEYSLLEVEAGIAKRIKKWNLRIEETNALLNEFVRTGGIRDAAHNIKREFKDIAKYLNSLEQNAKDATRTIREHLIVFPYTQDVWFKSHVRGLKGNPPYNLSDQKVYESVLSELPKIKDCNVIIFFTQDKEHFDHPDIHKELNDLGVELYFKSGEVVRRIEKIIE